MKICIFSLLTALMVTAGTALLASPVSADPYRSDFSVLLSDTDEAAILFVSGRYHDRGLHRPFTDRRHHLGKRHFGYERRDFHSHRHFKRHDHRHFGSPKYFLDRHDRRDRFLHDRRFRGSATIFCYRSGSVLICING